MILTSNTPDFNRATVPSTMSRTDVVTPDGFFEQLVGEGLGDDIRATIGRISDRLKPPPRTPADLIDGLDRGPCYLRLQRSNRPGVEPTSGHEEQEMGIRTIESIVAVLIVTASCASGSDESVSGTDVDVATTTSPVDTSTDVDTDDLFALFEMADGATWGTPVLHGVEGAFVLVPPLPDDPYAGGDVELRRR